MPPLREIVPGISPDVESVVLQALAKDPQQRFASIRAFADALGSVAYRVQALTLLKEGMVQQAQEALDAALALTSSSKQRLSLLSDYTAILASKGQWVEVLRYTEEALRLAPNEPGWLVGQQQAQMMLQQKTSSRSQKVNEQARSEPIPIQNTKEQPIGASNDAKISPKDFGEFKSINELFEAFFARDALLVIVSLK